MSRHGEAGAEQPTPGMPVAQALRLDPTLLPEQIFAVYCSDAALDDDERRQKAHDSFGKPGRDPLTISTVLMPMMDDPVWRRGMAVAQLSQNWEQIVGAAIAANCRPVSYKDGVLTIRPLSTVWGQQLTFRAPRIKQALNSRVKGLDVTEVKVTAASSITFRRGKWDVKGRGVRDTYF